MKHTKKALVSASLALLLCFAMLVGTTFAWFTDSVTSAGNIIKSGKLNIDLQMMDDAGAYQSVNNAPVFNYQLWEPGYTEWKNLKVTTTGNLALKYTMKIVANGTVSALADVIDVYYAAGEVAKPATRDLTGLNRVGTLKDVLNGTVEMLPDGILIPGTADANGVTASAAFTLALHMQESAGNEYQDLAIGTNFSLQLLATQFTYEADGFNNQYDADSEYASSASVSAAVPESRDLTITAPVSPAIESKPTVVEFTDVNADANSVVTLEVETENVISNESFNAGDVAQISLSLKGDTGNVTFTSAKITTYITAGLTNPVIKYGTSETWNTTAEDETDVDGNNAYYNAITGKLVFITTHFSDFVVSSDDVVYVKSIDKVYTDLQTAINAAAVGDTVVLLKDVEVTAAVDVNKSITVDGSSSSHTITASGNANGVFRIGTTNNGGYNVTLKNLKLTRTAGTRGRIIWTGDIASLTMENVDVDNTASISGNTFNDNYYQALTLGYENDQSTRRTIKISNCNIKNNANSHYAIIMFVPVDLTIDDSNIQGWANLYFKNSSTGSSVKVTGGTMTSVGNSGQTNSFGIIAIESGNNNISIKGTQISITAADDTTQSLALFSGWYGPNNGNTISIANSSITASGEGFKVNNGYGLYNTLNITSSTLNGQSLENANYSEGMITGNVAYKWYKNLDGESVIYFGGFYDFNSIVKNYSSSYFCNNEWLELYDDVNLDENLTLNMNSSELGSFGLIFGDYSITKGDYTLTIPVGVTIKCDKQLGTSFFTAPTGYTVTETALSDDSTYSYAYTVSND